MKKYLLTAFMFLIITFPGCSSSQTSVMNEETTNNIVVANELLKSKIDEVVESSNFRGVASVYYNGENIWCTENGFADRENETNNSVDHIYRIGSCTKQFTATGICILYDQGKLDFGSTIDKYFKGTKYGNKVTIKDLLNMTSGIPNFSGSDDSLYEESNLGFKISSDNTQEENKASMEKWILSQELSFEPQKKFEYSNSNYFLLGRIIEIVSGEKYEDFIAENIFEPLDMRSTSFDNDDLTTKGYIYDSVKTEEQLLKEQDTQWIFYPGAEFGASGINSSIEDLYKWINGLLNSEIIKNDTYEMMTETNNLGYGYGLFTNDYICFHDGAWGSYESEIIFSKDKKYISIILTNYYHRDFYGGIGQLIYNTIGENKELLG